MFFESDSNKSAADRWLDVADVLDAFRIIPRILLLTWVAFYMYYTWHITEKFLQLTDPSTAQTAFVTTVISALGTMSVWLGQIYINSRIIRDRSSDSYLDKDT